MLKTKTKKRHRQKHIHIIYIVIIILLIISNICFVLKYEKDDETQIEEVLFIPTNEEYDSSSKYYANIKFSKFKTLYKSNKVSTIAIIDNSSKTYNMFKEMINKIAYYKNTKIYMLETSKLSRKNEIAFYELDERLSSLETNYIITVINNKIISITTFDEEEINKIVKGLGE